MEYRGGHCEKKIIKVEGDIGRMVVINVVLNAISLYTLSFYKVPVKMLKELYII